MLPMEQWTPTTVFLCTYIAAALSGVGMLLNSDQEITARSVLAAVLLYGAAGCGLGMAGFEWLGGKENPWRVIGCGMLVGIRIIRLNDIKKVIAKLFSGDDSDSTGKP